MPHSSSQPPSDKPHKKPHKARKRFGQNFLVDDHIIGMIVAAIAPKPGQQIIEIGPGQGAITQPLLERCGALQLIELDRDLVPQLQAQFAHYPACRILQADALKTDFSQFYQSELNPSKSTSTEPAPTEPNPPQNQQPPALLRIVGNLPYNISTPLLFHLLSFKQYLSDMHFMLQKEVVNRLAAPVSSSAYGRLSVMTQYHCQVESLFAVPPNAFRPAPKVESAVVRLKPYNQQLRTPHPAADNTDHLSTLVATSFQQRRKTLRNNLKTLLTAEQLASLPIDLSRRPQDISVAEFVTLSNHIYQDKPDP